MIKPFISISILLTSILFAGTVMAEGLKEVEIKEVELKVGQNVKSNDLSHYTDQTDFLEQFGTMVKNSETYRRFVPFLTTAPESYKVSVDIVEINELKKLNANIHELIDYQKNLNAKIDVLLKELRENA